MKTFIKSSIITLCLYLFCIITMQAQVVVTPVCDTLPVNTYDTLLCKGGKIKLMAETGWGSYQWYNNSLPIVGATGSVYIASAGGTYKVTAQTGTTCATATKIITAKNGLTAPAAPVIVSSSTVICQGAISLSVKDTTGITAYQWGVNGGLLIGDIDSSITPYYAGDFFVTVQTKNGCTNVSDSVPVTLSTNVETPVITAYTSEAFLVAGNVASSNVSYQWYAEGRAIINYTSATMPLYYNSTYNVEVTYLSGGCKMFSANYVQKGLARNILRVAVAVTDSTILLPNVGATSFTVYPNPNNGTFAVDYSSTTDSTITIKLYSSTGVLVNSWNFGSVTGQFYETITVPGLVPGIYMLVLSDGSNSYTNKLVIE